MNSQSQTTGRFVEEGGHYRAIDQEFELEFVPVKNFRIEMGTAFSSHHIIGVPGLRIAANWRGRAFRSIFATGFSIGSMPRSALTLAVEAHADRSTRPRLRWCAVTAPNLTLAIDRELVPNFVVAALNLSYQPEWTRVVGTGAAEQESTIGAAFAVMAQLRPGFFLGGEARYLRRYEGIGLEELAGQALFLGPTAYFKLSRSPAADTGLEHPGVGTPGSDRDPVSIWSISSGTRRG